MVLKDELLNEVEREVLATLRREGRALAPLELIALLKDRGYPDDTIRTAIWYLIDRMELTLTPAFDLAIGTGEFIAAD